MSRPLDNSDDEITEVAVPRTRTGEAPPTVPATIEMLTEVQLRIKPLPNDEQLGEAETDPEIGPEPLDENDLVITVDEKPRR